MPNASSSLPSSARMPTRQDRPDDRGRGAGPLHQVQGDLPQPAHPAGAGGPPQDLWSVTSFFYHELFVSMLFRHMHSIKHVSS